MYSDLYSGSTRFEPRHADRLSLLRFDIVLVSLSRDHALNVSFQILSASSLVRRSSMRGSVVWAAGRGPRTAHKRRRGCVV
jgi:hypothetical protein